MAHYAGFPEIGLSPSFIGDNRVGVGERGRERAKSRVKFKFYDPNLTDRSNPFRGCLLPMRPIQRINRRVLPRALDIGLVLECSKMPKKLSSSQLGQFQLEITSNYRRHIKLCYARLRWKGQAPLLPCYWIGLASDEISVGRRDGRAKKQKRRRHCRFASRTLSAFLPSYPLSLARASLFVCQ